MADDLTLPAGTIAADDVGGVLYQRMKPAIGADGSATDVSASAPMPAYVVAQATGGATPFSSIDVDESEEEIKGSAGTVYAIHAMNMSASPRYLKFYNATAASVTVGTTVPILRFPLPTQGDTNGAGFSFTFPQGFQFDTAICVAATTGIADNDTGAPGANEVIVNIAYE